MGCSLHAVSKDVSAAYSVRVLSAGDLDVISFVGGHDHGTRAIVYENVGTKYHPELFELGTHAIADLYAAVCQNLGFECTLTVHDYDRDGECASPYRQALRYQDKP